MKLNEKYNDNSLIKIKDNRKAVVLKDKKGGNVCYRGDNNERNELIVYKIEEGILKNEPGLKCDFGLYTVSSNTIRFIELKGSDLKHAIKQIINSIKNVVDKNSIEVDRIHGRVVLSKVRTPDMNSTYEKELKRMLKKRNGDFRRENSVLKEVVD